MILFYFRMCQTFHDLIVLIYLLFFVSCNCSGSVRHSCVTVVGCKFANLLKQHLPHLKSAQNSKLYITGLISLPNTSVPPKISLTTSIKVLLPISASAVLLSRCFSHRGISSDRHLNFCSVAVLVKTDFSQESLQGSEGVPEHCTNDKCHQPVV